MDWYYREVEHYAWPTCRWTLESALVGLQDQFLHLLTWRQDSGTVQNLLNQLTKFAARMVQHPDGYTMRKRFLEALREPLCRAVLLRGLTPEYRNLAEIVSAAQQIEGAVCYELGTQHREEASSHTTSPESSNDGPESIVDYAEESVCDSPICD